MPRSEFPTKLTTKLTEPRAARYYVGLPGPEPVPRVYPPISANGRCGQCGETTTFAESDEPAYMIPPHQCRPNER